MAMLKEDCILENETDCATIHIWDNMITTLKNGASYDIRNLSVKTLNRKTPLGTIITTTFSEFDPVVNSIEGKNLLSNIRQTISLSEFKFTDKVNAFMLCQIPTCTK